MKPFIAYDKIEMGKLYLWFRSTRSNPSVYGIYEAPLVVYPRQGGGLLNNYTRTEVYDPMYGFRGDKFQEVEFPPG